MIDKVLSIVVVAMVFVFAIKESSVLIHDGFKRLFFLREAKKLFIGILIITIIAMIIDLSPMIYYGYEFFTKAPDIEKLIMGKV